MTYHVGERMNKPDVVTLTVGIVIILVITFCVVGYILSHVVYYMLPKLPQTTQYIQQ